MRNERRGKDAQKVLPGDLKQTKSTQEVNAGAVFSLH